jgi:hypothetical protein
MRIHADPDPELFSGGFSLSLIVLFTSFRKIYGKAIFYQQGFSAVCTFLQIFPLVCIRIRITQNA